MNPLANVYYKEEAGTYRMMNCKTQCITSISRLASTDTKSYNFEMFKGYDGSDDGLRLFMIDFTKWCNELRNHRELSIDYDSYYNNHIAVEATFKRLSKGRYESHDKITHIEHEWSNKCYNSGLMYCKKGEYESYGYDGNSHYPRVLASDELRIPTEEGKEYKLLELPQQLKAGYYNVKIKSDDPNFKKIFSCSPAHVYTHISLQHAIKHQKQFNVMIELVIKNSSNAYLYEEDCMISSSEVFGNWFDKLIRIKRICPKNKLLKHLLSSVWGHLSQIKRIHKTYDQVISEGLNIGRTSKSDYIIYEKHISDNQDYYTLIDKLHPYKFNLRFKSFMTAQGRNVTANVALLDIDCVVRINTDCVVFTKPMKMTNKSFIEEPKSSGIIQWNNVNKYEII